MDIKKLFLPKIHTPVQHGVANVPVIMQLEALECGAACLTMVLAYYEKWIPLEQVRVDCGVSRDGSNAKNILVAARNYGLTAKAYRFEPDFLRENGVFPCIIHWEFNHFMVLDGFRRGKAVLNDPARGTVEMPMEAFDKGFTGVCLMFEPGENFVPEGKKQSIMGFVKKKLTGTVPAIIFAVTLHLAGTLFGIIEPGFQRVFYDRLLVWKNPEWITPFLILLVVFNVLQIVLQVVQTLFNLRLEGKLAIASNSEYMWHILRLPVEFFSQRMAGDISLRKSSNETIAASMIQTMTPTVLDAIMIVIYLGVVINLSPIMTVVGLAGLLINAICARIVSNRRVNISRVLMRDSGKLQSTAVSGIEMIETIKASGAEDGFFRKWAGYQASVNTQNIRIMKMDQYFGLVPQLVSQIVNNVILGMGLYLTMRGQFTVGLITAFTGYLNKVTMPANALFNMSNSLREMRTDMERIEDVMNYQTDVSEESMSLKDDISYQKLSGRIEMKNVTFGYSKLAPPLIENFNMTVEPGQKVAFVGSSGCGKSTLAKLLTGLYRPWSGEILFDGKPIESIDRNLLTGSLAVVDQDIVLFNDTISANIRMWDSTIEDFEVILAARDASLHEDIMMRDGGYNYTMLEGGKDFSGGQRQRLEIARVLAMDPTIIIMDEATSALDARTEYEVVKSVKDRGITSIVIAHRLSTIRDCDEIIVMERGKIMERGTHAQLMKNHGLYETLITSE